MSTLSNPLLKTLTISNTCFTSSLHSPLIFIPKSVYFSNPSKPPKLPASLRLPKPTFSSTVVSCVAQTSDWEQDVALEEEVSDQEGANWGAQDFGSTETQVSDFGAEVDDGEAFPEPSEDAKLYVGNLPFNVDSEELAQIFEGAGIVEVAEVVYNRETDRSRGFGFVTMSTVEEAEKAVEMFHGYALDGRLLAVYKATPRGSRPERPPQGYAPCRIYVGNLPWDVDDDRLEQIFSQHGKVLSARIVLERETSRSRGFGFVSMASETEMNDAIAALDGQSVGGRAIRVSAAQERPRRNF